MDIREVQAEVHDGTIYAAELESRFLSPYLTYLQILEC